MSADIEGAHTLCGSPHVCERMDILQKGIFKTSIEPEVDRKYMSVE